MAAEKFVRNDLKTSVVLVGHGSKARGFEAPMKKVAQDLSRSGRYRDVIPAYFEIASPSIPEAVGLCVKRGASRVKVLPYFLLLGAHVTQDIPSIVASEKKKYSRRAAVILCPYLGYDPRISEVAKKRIEGR